MRRITRFVLAVAMLAVCAAPSFAQAPTLVQQSATELRACTVQQTATSAGNGAAVVTFSPPAGQYVYLCSLTIDEIANAAITGAAGPAPIFTSAGLQNVLIWWGNNATQTTGWQQVVVQDVWPLTMKSSGPGTAVTITNSAGQSTQNVRINATGYYAP